jgi:signal peptidase I
VEPAARPSANRSRAIVLAAFGATVLLGALGTVGSLCVTFNRLPTGSMAPTLLGRHAEARCPACAYPFFVGVREHEEVGADTVGECPLCEEEFDLTLDPLLQGSGIVSNRFGTPGRWDVALHEADSGALYAKRVIGLPGETLEFVGGDLLVDGVVQRKPDDLQARFWFPVHDARHIRAGASTWAAVGSATVAWDLSSQATQRWPGGAQASPWLELARPIVDTFAYNRANYPRTHAVGDVRLRARAAIDSGGELRVALAHDDRQVVASLRAGRVAIEVDGVAVAQAAVTLQVNAPWEVTFTYVDRHAALLVGESTLLAWDDPHPPAALSSSRVRLQVLTTSAATITDVRVDRDLYLGSAAYPRSRYDPAERPQSVPSAAYFLIGDNVMHSQDSRQLGFVPEASLRGVVLGSY